MLFIQLLKLVGTKLLVSCVIYKYSSFVDYEIEFLVYVK